MNSLGLLVDLFKNTTRQGPGSEPDTLRALSLIPIDPNKILQIADMGCGTGSHSIILAQKLKATITAVDIFPAFLDKLQEKAKKLNLDKKIQLIEASMDDLSFEKESLDMIWSEGAIYNIGFEKGIQYWHSFLKPGGHLAVSEITWTSEIRPKEVTNFWQKEYPEIDHAQGKIDLLKFYGFDLLDHFFLSQESWLSYYENMKKEFVLFLDRHDNAKAAQQLVRELNEEYNFYKKYKEYYSYGFYIAKKR
jgi:ubiquinone/menaquinone biosynthesis C-methylase UbiE